VRYLFTHQAGLPYLDQQVTREEVLDGRRVVEVLEQQEPVWEPGTAHGYHAVTYGWLAAELVARVTGRPFRQVLADEITSVLGLDLHIGLPSTEAPRVARLVDWPPPDPSVLESITDPALKTLVLELAAAMGDPSSTFTRSLTTSGALPVPDATIWNDPRIYAAEIPAGNGISNGRSLARMYAATVSEVGSVRLLTDATVDKLREEQASGPDRTLIVPTRFGTGFQQPGPTMPMLSSDSFGHSGLGGALGFADPRYRVGFGYVQNQLLATAATGDPRTIGVVAAIAEAIGAPPT
jgi:CubicO group peptidase (beta-lactamase class C family)